MADQFLTAEIITLDCKSIKLILSTDFMLKSKLLSQMNGHLNEVIIITH